MVNIQELLSSYRSLFLLPTEIIIAVVTKSRDSIYDKYHLNYKFANFFTFLLITINKIGNLYLLKYGPKKNK